MGRGQRRAIVQPIAHHQRAAALRFQVLQCGKLGLRAGLGLRENAERSGHVLDRRGAVARQDAGVDPLGLQGGDGRGGIGAQGIGKGDGLRAIPDPQLRGERLTFAFGPFKRDRKALPAPRQALAAHFAQIGDGRRRCPITQQCGGKAPAERMAARLRQPQCDGAGVGIQPADIGARGAQRQRAGLVQQRDVTFGKAFQRTAVLDQQPAPQQRAAGHHLRRRDGKPHRAGAGDDEHRNRNGQRLVPACARDHPARKRQRGKAVHHGGIKAAGAISNADIGAARLSGFVHQLGDFGNRGILCHAGKSHTDRRGKVDGACVHHASGGDRSGRAFAGQHRVVDRAGTVCHVAIGGQRFASGDQHQHPRLKRVGGHAAGGAVRRDHAGAFAHAPQQRANPGPCPRAHLGIQRAACQQEEQQHHCAFEIGMAAAGDGFVQTETRRQDHANRNRHVHVGAPVAQRHPGAGEERPPGISDHGQRNQRGKPMEQLPRCPVRARPDADRQQHDIHHAKARNAQRTVQALAFAILNAQRIFGNRLRFKAKA